MIVYYYRNRSIDYVFMLLLVGLTKVVLIKTSQKAGRLVVCNRFWCSESEKKLK